MRVLVSHWAWGYLVVTLWAGAGLVGPLWRGRCIRGELVGVVPTVQKQTQFKMFEPDHKHLSI